MIKRLKYKQVEYILASLVALVGFITYVKTLCPTVNFIDSGELATVCITFGVAHPTGYPLFTILGHLFSLLPLGLRQIYQMNLFSAVCCSVGLFFFFRLLTFLTEQLSTKQEKGETNQILTVEKVLHKYFPATVGTLMLAFSETFWSQALSIEVYPLHTVFLCLLLLLFLKAIQSDLSDITPVGEKKSSRYWYMFVYALGMSFTNHMTTILLAPACLYYYFSINGFGRNSWNKLLRLAPFFIMGLSVYLILPFRASQQPWLNWGNPTDIEKLYWHFSGKVYRVWLFASTDSAAKQLKYFLDTFPEEFAYVGSLFAIVGAWRLFMESKKAFVFTVLLFVGCVLYSINYDIHDIDSYFLLAYVTTAIWIGLGVRYLLMKAKDQKGMIVVAIVSLLVCGGVGMYCYPRVDESSNTLVEKYTKDMFKSTEPNALILSWQWDYFISAAYYFQKIENYRPDVSIIDKELLRRTWYYPQLKTHYPGIFDKSKAEIEAFGKELYKFEHDIQYDPAMIESRYTAVIRSFIDRNYNERPIYVTPEVEDQYVNVYERIPSGLALKISRGNNGFQDIDYPQFDYSVPSREDKYTEGIASLYGQAYMNKAAYLRFYGKMEKAELFTSKATEITNKMR